MRIKLLEDYSNINNKLRWYEVTNSLGIIKRDY